MLDFIKHVCYTFCRVRKELEKENVKMQAVYVVIERSEGKVNYRRVFDNYFDAVCFVLSCFSADLNLLCLYVDKHVFGKKVVSECIYRSVV